KDDQFEIRCKMYSETGHSLDSIEAEVGINSDCLKEIFAYLAESAKPDNRNSSLLYFNKSTLVSSIIKLSFFDNLLHIGVNEELKIRDREILKIWIKLLEIILLNKENNEMKGEGEEKSVEGEMK
ncbi:14188_t:CDS:2, partial [Dentiscutata erythropus]